jgi:SAM-dependent methyltransferase
MRYSLQGKAAARAALRDRLLERGDGWAGSSVRDACACDPAFRRAAPTLLATLTEHGSALRPWLDAVLATPRGDGAWATDPAGFLARRTLSWLQQRNQFLDLGPGEGARLAAIYRAAWCDLRAHLTPGATAAGPRPALESMFAAHQRRLAAFLLALDAASVAPGPGFVFREAICAEYPAALQARLLNLDLAALPEPILDLGCGERARLVAALRALGKVAVGVDRLAAPGDGVIAADWLDFPLAPGIWGTIVSHLGFSLHFLHHHLRPGDGAARHARRYMAILRSLRPGGIFAYAPGLPFIEVLLPPSEYHLSRHPLPLAVTGTPGAAPSAATPPLHATLVTRLA